MKPSKSGFPLPVITAKLRVTTLDWKSIFVKAEVEVLMLNINSGTMRVRVNATETVEQLQSYDDTDPGEIIENLWIGRLDDISAQPFFDQMKIVKS